MAGDRDRWSDNVAAQRDTSRDGRARGWARRPSCLVSNRRSHQAPRTVIMRGRTRRTRRSRVAECCPDGEDERAKPGRNYRSIRAHLLPLSCTELPKRGHEANVQCEMRPPLAAEAWISRDRKRVVASANASSVTGDTILSFHPLPFSLLFSFPFHFDCFGFRRLFVGKDRSLNAELWTILSLFLVLFSTMNSERLVYKRWIFFCFFFFRN